MALDEPKDADKIYNVGGFQYVVDKAFMEEAKTIKVDYQNIGFKLTSGLKLEAGCQSCSTADSGCS